MNAIHFFSIFIKTSIIGIVLSCNKQPSTVDDSAGTVVAAPPVSIDTSIKHYLALGDSYTIGESVSKTDTYPIVAAAILASQGINFAEPEVIARTGWTTGDLQSAISTTKFNYAFEIVTLLIGVNNQYRGSSLVTYRKEFEQNLKNAIVLAGGKPNHVVVLSIPDYGVTPFGQRDDAGRIAKEIDQFNKINREVSDISKVIYLDITQDSKRALEDHSMVAADSLHFSGKMYRIWAEKLAGVMKSNLP